MKTYKIILIAILAIFIGACNTATETAKTDNNKTASEKTVESNSTEDKKNETASGDLATPTDTIKAYVEAIKAEDEAAIKKALSKKTVNMLEAMARLKKKTFYENLTELDKDGELKQLPELRNEQIDGDKATLEVKGKSDENWTPVPFVKEEGAWKIAFLDNQFDAEMGKIKDQMEQIKKENQK